MSKIEWERAVIISHRIWVIKFIGTLVDNVITYVT